MDELSCNWCRIPSPHLLSSGSSGDDGRARVPGHWALARHGSELRMSSSCPVEHYSNIWVRSSIQNLELQEPNIKPTLTHQIDAKPPICASRPSQNLIVHLPQLVFASISNLAQSAVGLSQLSREDGVHFEQVFHAQKGLHLDFRLDQISLLHLLTNLGLQACDFRLFLTPIDCYFSLWIAESSTTTSVLRLVISQRLTSRL